jgi:hypothetical protein
MKKPSLFITVLILGLQEIGLAQSCLPEGIIFPNQASINNFQTNYPNCSEIEGDVTIRGVNITNLNGLSVLTSIGGTLKIANNDALISLSGLDNITNISGGLLLDTNAALSNLSALTNLVHIGGDFRMIWNDMLANLSGVGNLAFVGGDFYVCHNGSLQNLFGLNSLDTISGSLVISDNYMFNNLSGLSHLKAIQGDLVLARLYQLTSIQALSNLTTVGGDLIIQENYDLTSLSGLQNIDPASIDNLTIAMNYDLTDCDIASVCGFLSDPGGSINIYANNLGCRTPELMTSCGLPHSCLPYGNYYLEQDEIDNFQLYYPGCFDLHGDVYIWGENLEPLLCITSIEGDLTINNQYIISLNGLNNLTSIGGDFTVRFCDGLINMTGLNNLEVIGGSFASKDNYALLNFVGLNNVYTISGDLFLDMNYKLSSLTGFDKLDYLGGSLVASNNPKFVNFSGLEDLDSIGGDVLISSNTEMSSMTGLDNLASIGGNVLISGNTGMSSMTGLDNLASIGGGFKFEYNTALNDITSLIRLNAIGGDLFINSNSVLSSLYGLDSIASNSIGNLSITNNTGLSECEVRSICDYLGSPNGNVSISGNGAGCSSEQEVWLECTVSVSEFNPTQDFLIYPNPAVNEVHIVSSNKAMLIEASIYDLLGRKVLLDASYGNSINVSKLSEGLYVIEILTEEAKVRQKLMVSR